MRSRVLSVSGATVALAVVCLSAEQTGAQPAAAALPGATAAAQGQVSAVGSIQGAAWRADNQPIPGARMRLRNAASGRIQATAVATDTGTFTFTGIPPGTYLVEMVTAGGKVLAVGQPFTIGGGETVATFVRLGPRVPWFNGFFGSAAPAIAATAAATGITAVAPEEIPPVSAVR